MNAPDERYFMGTPCKRQHVGRRYRSTGACVDCQSQHSKAQNIKRAQVRQLSKEATCDSPAP